MENMRDFDRWLGTLSDDDIDSILYEFYLCLKEEECADSDGCGECPACMKANLQRKFHTESVLYGIDHEVAELGYEILEEHFPSAITQEVRETAIARGIIIIKSNFRKKDSKNKRDKRKEKRDERRGRRSAHSVAGVR
jgi:hypothetical protein